MSRRSQVHRSGRFRWWLEKEPSGLLADLILDPDAVLRGDGSVARARVGRKRFYRVARSENDTTEPALYVKVFSLPAGWPRLRYGLRPSKARREARIGRALVERGFEAAVPVAVGEERRAGLLSRSLSVVAEHPGRDLRALLTDPATSGDERRRIVEGFALFTRMLHDAGVDQDDYSPNNFLWRPDGRFCLLDFERCTLRRAPLPDDRRNTLLAKLHRHDLGVRRTDRLRFLQLYLGSDSDRRARRAAWNGIRECLLRIRRRDARHAARASFRPGRNLVREGDVWTVRGRESRPALRLSLPRRRARDAWITAHQLERLALPALRPVRLGRDWIELDVGDLPDGPAARADVAAAKRRLAPWGRFVASPDFVAGSRGALLRDPTQFRVSF